MDCLTVCVTERLLQPGGLHHLLLGLGEAGEGGSLRGEALLCFDILIYIDEGRVWRDGDADSRGGESCLFLCWWEGYPGPEWTPLCQVNRQKYFSHDILITIIPSGAETSLHHRRLSKPEKLWKKSCNI